MKVVSERVGVKWRWGFRVEVIVSSQAETETGTLLEYGKHI